MSAQVSEGVPTCDFLRRGMAVFGELLREHQRTLNRLNVFPVPDGDTGKNMVSTVRSVIAALENRQELNDVADVCRAITQGAFIGSRGHSGVILYQWLSGFTSELQTCEVVTASHMALAFGKAATLARQSMTRPVEGTMLSVAAAMQRGADEAVHQHQPLTETLKTGQGQGLVALMESPEQLDALAAARVVDAGGAGLLFVTEALLSAVEERPPSDVGWWLKPA